MQAWGPCVGAVLPQPGATKGKEACKCFSAGKWNIKNLVPCFWTYNNDTAHPYALSTTQQPSPDGGTPTIECKPQPPSDSQPPATPSSPIWSDDTLTVDCAGHFKLCYELKGGNFNNPLPTDCSLAKVCVEADYLKENVEQVFPQLASWKGSDTACAAAFEANGGYGEMTVIGESVRCDKVDDGNGNPYLFNRIQYCKSECQTNPSAPGCADCRQDGSGQF